MSFGWLSIFRAGSWKAFRKFALEEREDVEKRLKVIDAELRRIGEVTILWQREAGEDRDFTVTETREGFFVSGGSSLERLIQAYIAMGGNPFDISMFLQPDRVRVERDLRGRKQVTSDQPSGGVIYPITVDFYVGYTQVGGFLSVSKYPPRRMGGRKNPGTDSQAVSSRVRYMRRWLPQEIRTKRNNLEARIVKLCDLREQLIHERDVLIAQAVGGTIFSQPDRVAERYSEGFSVAKAVAVIDSFFFVKDLEDPGRFDFDSSNSAALTEMTTLFEDLESGEEEHTAL